ncbi:MAG TPA: hypothetical protein VK524_21860 [Polyangiaceae bacterium]|nr:hypothetical protein [Polyangiaceae bacterium]
MSARGVLLAKLVALLALVGCMPEIDRVAEVDTVRVLAVQKTAERDGQVVGAAYARPDETVNFHMLWDRGLIEQDVERMWITGCVNPAGDSYIGCLPFFAENIGNLDQFREQYVVELPAAPRPSASDTISVQMPAADVLHPAANTHEDRYALYTVFFAACAGDIDLSLDDVSLPDGKLPITCKRDGRTLDADEFVVGYTSVYIYENQPNTNPFIGSLFFDSDLPITQGSLCSRTDCFTAPEPTEADRDAFCAQNPQLCMDACPADGDIEQCPTHLLYPGVSELDPVNSEVDSVSQRNLLEQLTVHYHATRGLMRSDVRVIRDGTGAWNRDYGSNYYAPKDPGFVRVWAVVRDNRGGVDWISTPLYIR